jgi:hypothetical protein
MSKIRERATPKFSSRFGKVLSSTELINFNNK